MNITNTLKPILIYATLTASCAIKTNLTFSLRKWFISLIALILCIFVMTMIVITTDFSDENERALVSQSHVSLTYKRATMSNFIFSLQQVL